jgi:ATP phosphoribosyltransferase regulatory subunit
LRDLKALSERLTGAASVRCFDLAELRGYGYHSGVVFAAYAQGCSYAIALGGRYDEVGKAFGRARAATGFSMDLRELAALTSAAHAHSRVIAPYAPNDAALQRRIAALRRRGTPVVTELPGHAQNRSQPGCDRALVLRDNKWRLESITRSRNSEV